MMQWLATSIQPEYWPCFHPSPQPTRNWAEFKFFRFKIKQHWKSCCVETSKCRIYKRVYVIEYNLSNEMIKSSLTTFSLIWLRLRCCVNDQWMEIKICIRWYPQILLLVVWAHCPLESFCGDGTGFVVIKINWWWLSCSCVHSEKWFKLQFCFENICPRLSCLGVVTRSGDTQN